MAFFHIVHSSLSIVGVNIYSLPPALVIINEFSLSETGSASRIRQPSKYNWPFNLSNAFPDKSYNADINIPQEAHLHITHRFFNVVGQKCTLQSAPAELLILNSVALTTCFK